MIIFRIAWKVSTCIYPPGIKISPLSLEVWAGVWGLGFGVWGFRLGSPLGGWGFNWGLGFRLGFGVSVGVSAGVWGFTLTFAVNMAKIIEFV